MKIGQAAYTKFATFFQVTRPQLEKAPGFRQSCVDRNVYKGDWGCNGKQLCILYFHTWGNVTSSAIQCPGRQAVAKNDKIRFLIHSDLLDSSFWSCPQLSCTEHDDTPGTHLICKAWISLWGIPFTLPVTSVQTRICWWDGIPWHKPAEPSTAVFKFSAKSRIDMLCWTFSYHETWSDRALYDKSKTKYCDKMHDTNT